MNKGYKIIERKHDHKVFKIYIETDVNDADYMDAISYLTQEKFEMVLPLLKYLKHKYLEKEGKFEDYMSIVDSDELPDEYKDYSDEQLEEIDNLIDLPSSECGSGHTLEEIIVTMEDENGKLYNVEI